MRQTSFRKDSGLRGAIEGALATDYHSRIVDSIRGQRYVLTIGDVTFKLAQEFEVCYGGDRAVEYAYETRAEFLDRRVFLVGEIIHNPHVNAKLDGPVTVGVTAGASTPDTKIGEAIERMATMRGAGVEAVAG